jgi:hypothetical protein
MKLLQIRIWPAPTTAALSPPRMSLAKNEGDIKCQQMMTWFTYRSKEAEK